MRALALVAALLIAACSAGPLGGPVDRAAAPTQAPGTIAFAWTAASASAIPATSYSCKAGGDLSFHVVLSSASGALTVQFLMAKVDASGGEAPVGSPAPISLTGPDIVSFNDGPIAVSDLCGVLDAGNYVFRIVSSDGSKTLAEGKVTFAP